MIHDLKTSPESFAAIVDGRKRFEIRNDDRGFAVGDVLNLREWDSSLCTYTGRVQTRTVCYIERGLWIPADLVVMGFDDGPPDDDACPSPVVSARSVGAESARLIAVARAAAVAQFIDGHAKRLCEQAGNVWNRDNGEAEKWASSVHDVLNHLRADEDETVHDGRVEIVNVQIESERNYLRSMILHLAIAVGVDPVRAESVAEGWRQFAIATLMKVREIMVAARESVGGLLATLDPHGDQVIEFEDGDGAPMQIALGPHIAHRRWCDGYWSSEWEDCEVQHRWLAMPARLVSGFDADADPATRGPFGAKLQPPTPVVVANDDSAAVSLIVASRWGVRMDDGGEIRWCDSESEARQSYSQHVADDRKIPKE